MRERIKRIYGHAKKPFAALWRWAKGHGLHRWQGLRHWAANRKLQPQRAEYAKKVRWLKKHRPDPHPGDNFTTFDGLPAPKWIAEAAQKVRNAGRWKGHAISIYRTPEHSEDLCRAMCGAPSCPGRCAGRSSNHCCPPTFTGVYPEGAIDIDPASASTFEAECKRLNIPLKNDLASDANHFSNSGH